MACSLDNIEASKALFLSSSMTISAMPRPIFLKCIYRINKKHGDRARLEALVQKAHTDSVPSSRTQFERFGSITSLEAQMVKAM